VPILTYHSLDESGSVISVAEETFAEHMAILAERGYTAIRFDRLLDAWNGGADLPDRPVVLTFDDGFRNTLEHAAPVLTRHGFAATVFVVSGHCGGTSDWSDQGRDMPQLPLLNWAEARELSAAGWEVAAHSVSHARLPQLSAEAARREIVDCKAAIQDELGAPVTTFAYPYGETNAAVTDIAREQFGGAVSVRMGTARATDDRHLLPRLDMYYLRKPATFRRLGTAGGSAYLGLRALARRLRAGAGN
jgi:peptidoglycan/xylan/chitin deacetylase (PgdA/CDA1 family)